jgi:hypothetical protein
MLERAGILMSGLNSCIDKYEPTLRLIYRCAFVASIYLGLNEISDTMYQQHVATHGYINEVASAIRSIGTSIILSGH